MSRSLLGFLLFCGLLLLATAGVVWYMGPTLAGIAVSPERRSEPYFLLQLLPAAAVGGRQDVPSWRSRFVTLAGDDQGRLLWQGTAVHVVEGSVLLDVAGVQLIRFDSGAELVQMLTSSAYRALASELTGPVSHLGSAHPPGTLDTGGASVLVLYRADPASRGPGAGSAAPLGVPGNRGWLALLPDYRGTVQWDAPVAQVRGPGNWTRVLLLQFPDARAAEAWLADPATVTERAIAGKQVSDMVVLLVQPSSEGGRWNSRTVPNSSNSPRLGNVRAGTSASSR